MQPNFDSYHIRKWFSCEEEILANETGQLADGSALRKVMVAAVIHNPYDGRFSQDLNLLVEKSSRLGEEFERRIMARNKAERVESYGKASIVGLAGEYEHGN